MKHVLWLLCALVFLCQCQSTSSSGPATDAVAGDSQSDPGSTDLAATDQTQQSSACPQGCAELESCVDNVCVETACIGVVCGQNQVCSAGDCLCQEGWSGDDCLDLIAPTIPWNEGPYGAGIKDVAADFTLDTLLGSWNLRENWSGNDSFLFIIKYAQSPLNNWVWDSSLSDLLTRAPLNIHIVFGSYDTSFHDDMVAIEARMNTALAGLSEEGQAHWQGRIHYIDKQAMFLSGGLGDFITAFGTFWFTIDRFQRWREVGSLFDWKAYYNGQPQSEQYPIYFISYESIYSNYEANIHREMELMDATDVVIWEDGDHHDGGWGGGHTSTWEVVFPEAEAMEQFDSMAMHMTLLCPDHLQGKDNGCNEWDYIQHLHVCDVEIESTDPQEGTENCQAKVPGTDEVMGSCDSGDECTSDSDCSDESSCQGYVAAVDEIPADTLPCSCTTPLGEEVETTRKCMDDGSAYGECQCACGTEIGRWVTPYGREGEWLTDLSPLLPLFADGGTRSLRFKSVNGYDMDGRIMLYNANKGYRPIKAQYLWGKPNGTGFNQDYNNGKHSDVSFDLPEGTTRTGLTAVISGHGSATTDQNCAEFCNHQHEFTVNGTVHMEDHPDVGSWYGCMEQTHLGGVPNQFGTWPFGRAGWCAGMDIKLWNVDLTNNVTATDNNLSYRGLLNGQDYIPTYTDEGDYNPEIKMSSWLVFYGAN